VSQVFSAWFLAISSVDWVIFSLHFEPVLLSLHKEALQGHAEELLAFSVTSASPSLLSTSFSIKLLLRKMTHFRQAVLLCT